MSTRNFEALQDQIRWHAREEFVVVEQDLAKHAFESRCSRIPENVGTVNAKAIGFAKVGTLVYDGADKTINVASLPEPETRYDITHRYRYRPVDWNIVDTASEDLKPIVDKVGVRLRPYGMAAFELLLPDR